MTQQHPITPPPELLKQWEEVWFNGRYSRLNIDVLILEVFQAGADQELEACIKVIADHKWFASPYYRMAELRAARRPKPPSLKEQALATLQKISKDSYPCSYQDDGDWDTIRRALESIPDHS
jgi:hypothetical protein